MLYKKNQTKEFLTGTKSVKENGKLHVMAYLRFPINVL